MLLSNQKTLEDHIVLLLSEQHHLTAKQIQTHIEQFHPNVTIQGIYRVLRILQKSAIVVKHDQRYSLHMSWTMSMRELVKRMEETYFEPAYLSTILPERAGERQVWHFTSLLKMLDFWGQALLAMTSAMPDPPIALDYSPHLWYELIMPEKEYQFINAYQHKLKKEYIIVGYKTLIDKYNAATNHKVNQEIYLATDGERQKIEKKNNIHIDVIGDLVLKAKLSDDIVKDIQALYRQKSPDPDEVLRVFTKKTKAKIVIKKDAALAEKYYKKFEKIFGPL